MKFNCEKEVLGGITAGRFLFSLKMIEYES